MQLGCRCSTFRVRAVGADWWRMLGMLWHTDSPLVFENIQTYCTCDWTDVGMPDFCDKPHLWEDSWTQDGEKLLGGGAGERGWEHHSGPLSEIVLPTLGGLNGYVSGILISSWYLPPGRESTWQKSLKNFPWHWFDFAMGMVHMQSSTQKPCSPQNLKLSSLSVQIMWNTIKTEFMGLVVILEASKAHAFTVNFFDETRVNYNKMIARGRLKMYCVEAVVSSSHIYVPLDSEMDSLGVNLWSCHSWIAL